MLTARRETVLPPPTTLWCPGHKFEGFTAVDPLTSRGEEIERRRHELLSLIRDTPESEFELSLTDLVEKRFLDETGGGEGEEREPQPQSGHKGYYDKVSVKERKCFVDGSSNRRRTRSRSTGSDGVLLNMFVPKSLGRSFTWSHSRRSSSLRKTTSDHVEIREKESYLTGCWPNLWNIARTKANRTEITDHSLDNRMPETSISKVTRN